MKVRDLLSALSALDADAEVLIAHESGDFWRTTVAEHIDAVETAQLVWSPYHEAWTLPSDERPTQDGPTRSAVVMR